MASLDLSYDYWFPRKRLFSKIHEISHIFCIPGTIARQYDEFWPSKLLVTEKNIVCCVFTLQIQREKLLSSFETIFLHGHASFFVGSPQKIISTARSSPQPYIFVVLQTKILVMANRNIRQNECTSLWFCFKKKFPKNTRTSNFHRILKILLEVQNYQTKCSSRRFARTYQRLWVCLSASCWVFLAFWRYSSQSSWKNRITLL